MSEPVSSGEYVDANIDARVSVVVLTYNGRELLDLVLPSLATQRYQQFATIVVDNGSTDDTMQWLGETWPEVAVVSLPENIGVTAALNVCFQAGDGELIALLNNDLELDPNCLGELVNALDAHPEAAVATAKLINFHDRELIDGAGDIYDWTGVSDRRGQGMRDVGQYDDPQPIFSACGGAAVYRRSAVEQVGPFDEDFFAYKEDVDWSFRAQLLGYSCRYVPTAIAYHISGATLGSDLNEFALYQNWRNGIWVVAKNYPLSALLRHGYRFLNAQRGILKWAFHTGRLRVFARAWCDAVLAMPAVLRKRHGVQRSRRIGLHELEHLIGVDR
jgi:GT2 family glycosyltransferase